ncbi:MAG TPA: methyltransferase domain-containing protein [Kofleriaceae bacterium]|nr:methyltransferase domain-containing protein [Kofleriaceae bacterium]
MAGDYGEQRRGNREAYRRYLDGMDASLRQKVAFPAAHLVAEGRVADMGMGSGATTHALAALYPALDVVGVDVSAEMVAMAREAHSLPNLSFVQGDVGERVFEPGSLDAIFDSSVLHHVTSFGGYDRAAAGRALETQAAQLAVGGLLIVRDFLDPGADDVWLDVRADDGEPGDDPRRCSTAALLERFAREFRSLSDAPGFRCVAVTPADGDPPLAAGRRRYRTSLTMAAEFLLRKDYRTDWESEVKEEYTYFTQAEFEACYARLGLRLLASTPIRNPWIVRNRWRGAVALHAAAGGAPLELPPTNYVIAGEKVRPGEGVRFVERAPHERLGFLVMEHHRHTVTGQVRDVVRRPHLSIDILPWFRAGEDLFVLTRKSYPRPILQSDPRGCPSIDGRRRPGYITEPLVALQEDRPVGQTVEEALAAMAHVDGDRIVAFRAGGTYYPSPGGVQEEVRSLLVEIEPVFVERDLENRSGFSTAGQVRAIEARQLLRSAQVGALPDARLELNVMQLLVELGESTGPWIGEAIALGDAAFSPAVIELAALRARPARRQYRRAAAGDSAGFLAIECATFEELDAAGAVVARQPLELVVPRRLSTSTVALAPLARVDGRVLLGIDDDDLPAAQAFNGNSQLLVAPAWRLPHAVAGEGAARAWALERLATEYGADGGDVWELGGPYHPSPGVTPEVVHPFAVEVRSERPAPRRLTWIPLDEVPRNLGDLLDGHLRIAALRACHALGLLR